MLIPQIIATHLSFLEKGVTANPIENKTLELLSTAEINRLIYIQSKQSNSTISKLLGSNYIPFEHYTIQSFKRRLKEHETILLEINDSNDWLAVQLRSIISHKRATALIMLYLKIDDEDFIESVLEELFANEGLINIIVIYEFQEQIYQKTYSPFRRQMETCFQINKCLEQKLKDLNRYTIKVWMTKKEFVTSPIYSRNRTLIGFDGVDGFMVQNVFKEMNAQVEYIELPYEKGKKEPQVCLLSEVKENYMLQQQNFIT